MLHNSDQWLSVFYLLAVLFLVAGGWRWQRLRGLGAERLVKYGVLWLGIVLALILLYDYWGRP